MPAIGMSCVRGKVSFDECRQCAKSPAHPCQYTPDLLALIRRDGDNEPSGMSFTPSRLLHCLRQPVLEQDNDYYIDVDVAWSMSRGHLFHGSMESKAWPGAVGVIREHRFHATVETKDGPQEFSSKPDLIVVNAVVGGKPNTAHITIVDYKTRDFGHELVEADREHQLQVNMYAWLARQGLPKPYDTCKVVVDELIVQYVSLSKTRRFTSAGPLQVRGKRITGSKPTEYETLELQPVRMFEDDKILRYIRGRIEAKVRALTVLPPKLEGDAAKWCWRCPMFGPCQAAG